MHVGLRGAAMLLVAVAMTTLATSGSASAVDSGKSGSTAECSSLKDNNDDTISILGLVCDRRETPQVPVEGVSITVEDSTGEVVDEVSTKPDGTFVVDLPGSALDNLGESFTVRLDEDSLPEGSQPDVLERTISINTDSDQSVTFPIGAAGAAGSGFAVQTAQLFVGGIVFSILLAMAALGLSMIFGTTGLTNFSHGELVTFGAIVAYAFDQLPGTVRLGDLNVTVAIGVVIAFVVSAAFGWANDAGLWRPLRRRGTGVIAMMIVSIGLSIFLRNIYQYFTGAGSRNYSQYSAIEPWELGPILVTPKELIVAVVGMIMLIVATSLLRFSRLGKATRSVADNPALSAATGIDVERVITLVWIGGAALAGLSGALLGLTQGFDYQIGFKLLLLIFAAVVLGGLGTIWGAIIGAFIIGLFTELSTLLVPAEFKFVGALLLLIVVLLIRPQGLLGRAQRIG